MTSLRRFPCVRAGLLWGLAAACGLVLFQDWRAAANLRAREEAYARIVKGYDVVIELPK